MPTTNKLTAISSFFLALLLYSLLQAAAAAATELIRNGDFSGGLAEWRIAQGISPSWDPLAANNGMANLHPSTTGMGMVGYSGPVLLQDLNVTSISSRQIDLSFDLAADWQPSAGNAIQARIIYLDSTGVEKTATLSTSANASIAVLPDPASRVKASYIFPADAARLVRFLFYKNANGSFSAANVSLSMTGVTVGPLPEITGLSASAAAHGDSLTISGQNFGTRTNASAVLIDDRPEGVTIINWNDTAIQITVNAPATSGPVKVLADGVRSANTKPLDITSPYFSITGTADRFKVIRGTPLNIALGVGFANGYTPPAGGLTWSLVDGAGNPLAATFSPATLHGQGGTILSVDTASIPTGEQKMEVRLTDGTTTTAGTGYLHIVTVGSLGFQQCVTDYTAPPYPTTCTTVTSLAVNRYGRLDGINPVMNDNEGNPLDSITTDMTATSSNPTALMVYDPHTPWSGPEVWAIANPPSNPVNVTIGFADGSSASLPVTITIPASPSLTASVSPSTVSNLYADPIQESISGDNSLISAGDNGLPNVIQDSRTWDSNNTFYGGTFKLDLSQGPATTGTILLTGTMNDGQGGSIPTATPLTIVNDPSLAAASGSAASIDPALDPISLEHFFLEFYDDAGLQFSREVFNSHSTDGSFHVDGLTPGSYQVKCVVDAYINGQQRTMEQWYPNAVTQTEAQNVTLTADGETPGLNFFFVAPPIPYYSIGGHLSLPDGSPYVGGVNLLDNNSTVAASVTIDNGDYLFANISEGYYTVQPVQGQGSASVSLFGGDSLANGFTVSPTSMTFHGFLVLTDPSGPAMGQTGAYAYRVSAPSYDDGNGQIYTTGADCTAENTRTLTDCSGVHLDLNNLSLSLFQPAGDGDHRVYSNATATVSDGLHNTLFTSGNLNISMALNYTTDTTTGNGVAGLDANNPTASALRGEMGYPSGQVEFAFTSFSPVVEGQFGVYEFTLEVRPALAPMPTISFTNLPYRQRKSGGSQLVTVSLNQPPTRTIAIDYTTADGTALAGSDYTATSGTLVWAPGSGADQSFSVPIQNATSPKADKTYTITLSRPVNGIIGGQNPVQATVIGTVPGDVNDDGQVTLLDAILTQQILTDQVPAGSTISLGADVNHNGAIDPAEGSFILHKLDGQP